MKSSNFSSFFLLILFLVSSCSTQKIARVALKRIKPDYSFNKDSIPKAPEYSNLSDWYLFQNRDSSQMDVFFLHPTTYMKKDNWNQLLGDSSISQKTIRKSIRSQAMLFDSIANLYAPRYRQATFYSFFDEGNNGAEALNIAYIDVKNAFIYYLENENKGKPFILAGHSQGSYLALQLLKDKGVQDLIGDKMIVAYIMGWPVLEHDLAEMPYPFCQDSTDLECLTSWNAQKAHSSVSIREYAKGEKMYSTNPLSWTLDENYYDNSYNKGAVILNRDSLIFRPNYIGARNYKGILAIDRPTEKKELGIKRHSGNYHIYDVAFFYRNIQENAELRKRMCLEKRME